MAANCWDRASTASFIILAGAAFVLLLTMTAGSAAVVEAVRRDGATDGPMDGDRADVATASDVEVISTRCNMNERTNAR